MSDEPKYSSFFGLDTGVREATDWSKPQTRDDLMAALEKGMQNILNSPTPIPCGMEGNPHLTAPRPSFGKIWRCVNCGDLLVKVGEDGARQADLEDFPEGTTLEGVLALSFASKGGCR